MKLISFTTIIFFYLTPMLACSLESKRGLAFSEESLLTPFQQHASAFSWTYNWGSKIPVDFHNFEYVPMFHGSQQIDADFRASVGGITHSSSKHILGMNEPDFVKIQNGKATGATQISPKDAAKMYADNVSPWGRKGFRLGTPAVTSDNLTDNATGYPTGVIWLKSFKEELLSYCSGCKLDFVAIHWYGSAGSDAFTQANQLLDYLDSYAIPYVQTLWPGIKVWITELRAAAPGGVNAEAFDAEFMKYALPRLDENANVERYAYMKVDDDFLISMDGKDAVLSQAGTAYASD